MWHFRNVKVQKPNERYTEVFIDEGEKRYVCRNQEMSERESIAPIYPSIPADLNYEPHGQLPVTVSRGRWLCRFRIQRGLYKSHDAAALALM